MTVRLKASTVSEGTWGAVKDATAVAALATVTTGPAVWVHAQAVILPSGSADAVPSRVTVEPSATAGGALAAATGGWLGTVTLRLPGVAVACPGAAWAVETTIPPRVTG